MARFILDVANCDTKETTEIMYGLLETELLVGKVTRITIIDEENTNQFHENELENVLSDEQIQNYNNELELLSKQL